MNDVSFKDALKFWIKLGFISFGGPAGQIAIMQQELVEKNQWISQPSFSRALNFCMILPGPEAQQLATYMGWRSARHPGRGAGRLFFRAAFGVPDHVPELAGRLQAGEYRPLPGLFYGVQPVVVAVVIDGGGEDSQKVPAPSGHVPVPRWRRSWRSDFWGISFPWVVLGAAAGGMILHRFWPQTSCLGTWEPESKTCVVR
jgi:chromate transporter